MRPIPENIRRAIVHLKDCFGRSSGSSWESCCSETNAIVHFGRHIETCPSRWLNAISKMLIAGMHARYGNAQGDNHALCESWIGQRDISQSNEVRGIPKGDRTSTLGFPGAEVSDSCFRRAMPALDALWYSKDPP